jgi:hypothetical protein
MTIRSVFSFLAVSSLLVLASPAHAGLITNGSFETPDIPTGTFAVFAAIPGWSTSFGPGIEVQDHVAGSPYDGDQFVELDSFSNSGMMQASIPTVLGNPYLVSFAYSPRPGRSAADNGIDVYFNGGLLISLATNGIGLQDTSWTVYSFPVIATGATSSLEFRAVGLSTSFGGYLDAVDAVGAPEPSTLLLLCAGLATMRAYRRRRAM